MPRKFFVGGNWKCNGTVASVNELIDVLNAGSVPGPDVVEVVCSPPAIFIPIVKSKLRSDFAVAAQNCWVKSGGAYTGEISADMLADYGVPWVILGHSERRALINESSEFIADKTKYAISKGLSVILCCGETLEEREADRTFAVIAEQLQPAADKLTKEEWAKVVIAYEPVWAIGTGKVATPEQAQEVHKWLRGWLAEHVSPEVAAETRILYGGSVNEKNCGELAGQPDIDGFLVGGASLKAGFIDIVNSATKSS